jgi:hypothetical protein
VIVQKGQRWTQRLCGAAVRPPPPMTEAGRAPGQTPTRAIMVPYPCRSVSTVPLEVLLEQTWTRNLALQELNDRCRIRVQTGPCGLHVWQVADIYGEWN